MYGVENLLLMGYGLQWLYCLCYNQFASELEITSNSGELTSCTYSMINEAKDVTSDFPNNLKACDIIFPSDHHVVAYLGDGQIIEEPQTGDVCKTRCYSLG